jgi:hypothetical protein
VRRDTGNRNQQIVPGPQILIPPNHVHDRLIERGNLGDGNDSFHQFTQRGVDA